MSEAIYDFVRSLMQESQGRFVTACFIKKDGTERIMRIQPAALKLHVLGPLASESAQKAAETRRLNHPELLNVWDVEKQAPRSVNIDTLRWIKADRQTYEFTNGSVKITKT